MQKKVPAIFFVFLCLSKCLRLCIFQALERSLNLESTGNLVYYGKFPEELQEFTAVLSNFVFGYKKNEGILGSITASGNLEGSAAERRQGDIFLIFTTILD